MTPPTPPRFFDPVGVLHALMGLSARNPWKTLTLWALAAALGVAAATWRLSVNTDASDMLPKTAPHRIANTAMDRAFPLLDNTVIALVSADSAEAADAGTRAMVAGLRARPDLAPAVFAPAVEPYFVDNGLVFLAPLDLQQVLGDLNQAAPLIERLNQDPSVAELFAILTEAADNADYLGDADAVLADIHAALAATITARLDGAPRPLSWRALFDDDPGDSAGSETGPHRRIITITPAPKFNQTSPLRPLRDAVTDIAARANTQLAEPVSVALTGELVMRGEELRSVTEGVGLALIISLTLVGVLLIAATRSAVLGAAVLGVVIAAVAITAGVAALVFGALNLISIAFAVLLVGLGVDFALHLALNLRRTLAEEAALEPAIEATARQIGGALMLAAPTTALAFFSFLATDFIGMAQLGVVAGLGVLIAFAVAVCIMPAMFALNPLKPRPSSPLTDAPWLSPRLRVGLAAGAIALAVPGAILAGNARFDADPMGLRNPEAPSVVTFNTLFQLENAAPYRLDALADTPQDAETLAAQLGTLDTVDEAISLADLVPTGQTEKLDIISYAGFGLIPAVRAAPNGAPSPPDIAPATARALAQSLQTRDAPRSETTDLVTALSGYITAAETDPEISIGLNDDLLAYWPDLMAMLARQLAVQPITTADIPGTIRARYVSQSGFQRISITPAEDVRDPDARARFVADVTAIAPSAAGGVRTSLAAAQIIAAAMVQAIAVAAFGVAILVWITVRDLRLTGAILATLALAGVLTTATGVLLDQPFNFANVIVLPLLIGVGVDAAIHLALRARDVGAAGVFLTTTPRAVMFSALTTMASFGSLAFSAHRGTASMGVLLAVAMIWTVTCVVFVLPLAVDGLRRAAPANPGDAP